jgi:chromate transporter
MRKREEAPMKYETPENRTSAGDQGKYVSLWRFLGYFLKLGTIGFGGPVALAGFMNRDLVEKRGWVSEDEYKLGLTLAQVMPGPMAAQLAIALGYFQYGIIGATLVALAFVVPSFLMVVGLAILYLQYSGLWWMQALFYGIGASVIAIIAIAVCKLARMTNKHDSLQWGIFAVLLVVTVATKAELAWLFIFSGFLVLFLRTPPRWRKERIHFFSLATLPTLQAFIQTMTPGAGSVSGGLLQIFLFFFKTSFFVFGSGLAIVPFLYKGLVQDFGWLNEGQFLDAVAVAMITPGPVVITVGFIGYLVARLPGAFLAALGVFLPVYLLTIIPAPWLRRNRDNPQLKSFVQGATASATGALTGAVIILGQRAIFDLPTGGIALASLFLLWRFKLPEPIIVLLAGGVGLCIWVLRK